MELEYQSSPPPPSSSPHHEEERELFVVQKCWFDGPKIEPPVDCLRLFEQRSDAERVAHESAHLFACANNSASVRTILLPSTNHQGASCGFVCAGKLFWVRSLWSTVVPTTSSSNGSNSMLTTGGSSSSPSCSYWYAHAILTARVIGGTGNVGSRRGTEAARGRVFVSLNAESSYRAAAAAAAQQQRTALQQSATHYSVPPGLHSVIPLPIGVSTATSAIGMATKAGGDGMNQVRAVAQQQLSQDWPCDQSGWTTCNNTNKNSNAIGDGASTISGSGMKRRELSGRNEDGMENSAQREFRGHY